MADATQRFASRVDNYIRYRPSYPPALLHCLEQHGGLKRASLVADIGAGTGIFTMQLLTAADQVFAVEPNGPMRAAAERLLHLYSGFVPIAGTAEATTLPENSVDLITCAQAFHWFDATACRAEFARILRPGGHVALIWNERLTDSSPFLLAYEQHLLSRSLDYSQVNHTRIDAAAIGDFFAPESYAEFHFPNEQTFDLEGLKGRALSSSYVPDVGQPGHDEFMTRLHEIFDQHAIDGRVVFSYETRLYLGCLSSRP